MLRIIDERYREGFAALVASADIRHSANREGSVARKGTTRVRFGFS